MLDITKMDKEEAELWEMLTSKFEGKELIRVLQLIAIDAKKHHDEQLLNSRLHGVVGRSEQLVCECSPKTRFFNLKTGKCLECGKEVEEAN